MKLKINFNQNWQEETESELKVKLFKRFPTFLVDSHLQKASEVLGCSACLNTPWALFRRGIIKLGGLWATAMISVTYKLCPVFIFSPLTYVDECLRYGRPWSCCAAPRFDSGTFSKDDYCVFTQRLLFKFLIRGVQLSFSFSELWSEGWQSAVQRGGRRLRYLSGGFQRPYSPSLSSKKAYISKYIESFIQTWRESRGKKAVFYCPLLFTTPLTIATIICLLSGSELTFFYLQPTS